MDTKTHTVIMEIFLEVVLLVMALLVMVYFWNQISIGIIW
jgi:hypothetical protein